jgi:hypothetical protein
MAALERRDTLVGAGAGLIQKAHAGLFLKQASRPAAH